MVVGTALADAPLPGDMARAAEILGQPPIFIQRTPRFHPDGKSIAFVSNAERRLALYVKDLDGSAPARRIGHVPARFRRPAFSPDGLFLYFTSDENGDEAYSIHRIDIATGRIEEVTIGPKLRRDGPWFVSDDRFFFSARHKDERGLALYEQHTAPGSQPRLVYANEELKLAGIRSDAAQLLLLEGAKSTELFALELPMELPPRRLFPEPHKDLSITSVSYSADGARVLLATDDGGDASHLLALDVATGAVLARYTEAGSGTIRSLRVHGDRLAFIVDAGTRHEVRIAESATLALLYTLELPLGSEVPGSGHPNQTSSFSLSPDGRHLAMQWSTPSLPPHVVIVDVKDGSYSPLLGAPTNPPISLQAEVVTIPSFDGLGIPSLLYLPPNARNCPVIVSVHGGFAFAATARYDMMIALLVAEGYAVVEPNVRGSGGFGRSFESADDGARKLDAVRDLGEVGRWAIVQPWADSSRLSIIGKSAGGYYTLLALAHQPELWRAGVCVAGIYDLESMMRTTDGDLRAYYEKEFAPLDQPALLAEVSPSTHVDRIRAPVFVVAGENDARAPKGQADALVRALRSRGHPVEYMLVEGQGHSLDNPRLRALFWARTLRFLAAALAPRSA